MEARYSGFFCDVPGFLLGNNQDIPGGTGVTVIRCPEGTVGGGEVRGGAPGSRETDLLRPENTVQNVHAVVLAGGSAFGLAACDGVMKRLKEENIGFETGYGVVPIVPGCVLFDRGVGDADAFPTAEMGYRACRFASNDENSHRMGNIGAGTGCSVGKLHGADRAMKSGLGQASMSKGDLVVSAVVCVNALGDVFDFLRDNEPIAGLLQENMWYDSTVANLQATFCPNLEGRNKIGRASCRERV